MGNKTRALSLVTGLVLASSGTVTAQQTSVPSATGD